MGTALLTSGNDSRLCGSHRERPLLLVIVLGRLADTELHLLVDHGFDGVLLAGQVAVHRRTIVGSALHLPFAPARGLHRNHTAVLQGLRQGGIKSGMKSYPEAHHVLADIGAKTVEAFSRAVKGASDDLRKYRETFPQWVADHGERGLANWISDRVWARLLIAADGVPDMTMIERGVTREITLGLNYRFRVKRHDYEGSIASYETPTFLDFVEQPEGQLDGMQEIRLVAGYEWHNDVREIGDAVISLRDGKDNVIWKEHLPAFPDEQEGEDGGTVVVPQEPQPRPPQIGVREVPSQDAQDPTDQR